MHLLDSLKAELGRARHKVSDLVLQHEDKVERGLDKAADVVDKKTKGKYSHKIQTGTGKAKDAVERLAHMDSGSAGGDSASGSSTSPDAPEPPPAS